MSGIRLYPLQHHGSGWRRSHAQEAWRLSVFFWRHWRFPGHLPDVGSSHQCHGSPLQRLSAESWSRCTSSQGLLPPSGHTQGLCAHGSSQPAAQSWLWQLTGEVGRNKVCWMCFSVGWQRKPGAVQGARQPLVGFLTCSSPEHSLRHH